MVRLTLMEADKEISRQQENVYGVKVQIQSEEQRIDFHRKDLSQLTRTEAETCAALRQLEEKTKTIGGEIEELQQAKESFVQLSLFEEGFLQQKEQELNKLQAELRCLQSDLDREKEALIEAANQIAYFKNDTLAKSHRCEEISKELARSRDEHAAASSALELL